VGCQQFGFANFGWSVSFDGACFVLGGWHYPKLCAVGYGSVTIRLDVSIVQDLGDHTNTVSGEARLFDYFEKFASIYQVDPENANE
jgi:hypothetical protein